MRINKKLLRFICFCFVGGTSALIDLIVFNIAYYLGFAFILCRIFAVGFSIIYNFSMNRNITFSAKGQSIKEQIPRYAVVYAISVGVNLIVSFIMVTLLEPGTINANISAFTGIVVSIPFSFFGSLLWAFKDRKRVDVEEEIEKTVIS